MRSGLFGSFRAGFVAAVVTAGMLTVAGTAAHADPASSPSAAQDGTPLTTEQALAQAQTTGHAVAVSGATTATDTVTANPDGTLTRTISMAPLRKRVSGAWADLNPTLVRDADGSITTTVTTSDLRLSAGGAEPLATMTMNGRSLAFTLPMTLPAPTLSGTTATYPAVLPGVDLRVTADQQGDFSEVLIVHDASAATNPALKTLKLSTTANGVTVSSDATGNITATDLSGSPVFNAPAPLMWDSATGSSAAARQKAPAALPGASSADGPGDGAHTAPVAVDTTPTAINLTPNQGLLTGTSTVYPVYIDPSWLASGRALSGWSTITPNFPDTRYWNTTPEPNGHMQVGNAGSILSHTLINFPIDTATLAGATINDATLNITEIWSYSCNASVVNVYTPGPTLSYSNATWNNWAPVNMGSVVASANVAYGYNSSCPNHGVGFNIKSAIQADVNANKKVQTFAFIGGDESSEESWKKFDEKTPTITIHYDHAPNTPTGMTTSPTTSCTAATPTIVGDNGITLYAPVSDRDGGSLGVGFSLWQTSNPSKILASSSMSTFTYTSGRTAVLYVSRDLLHNTAAGAITQFSWHVQVSDGLFTSGISATCSFRYDPTRPGQPSLPPTLDGTQVGVPVTVTVTPPPSDPVPTKYMYQLNAGPPRTVAAPSGTIDVTVTPTRATNTLTVTSLSAGGNVGDTARLLFNSDPQAEASPNDLTGDGAADLVTVGNVNGLPSGLWQAAGRNTGQLAIGATDIGMYGNGASSDYSPTDFDGAQVITGSFTGPHAQAVLVYYPTGNGMVLQPPGDGTPILAQFNENESGLATLVDDNGEVPMTVAAAGDASGQGLAYPDLIAISGDPTGNACGDPDGTDASGDYYLDFYPSQDGIGTYNHPTTLATKTPAGGCDWNNWTIASAQVASGTDMFLWNKGTGALWLWADLTFDMGAGTLSYTPYQISTSWNTSASSTVQIEAADIDGNGTPDLWTVDGSASSKAWLVNLDGTPSISGQTAQTLSTNTHTWKLDDVTQDSPITHTLDSAYHSTDTANPDPGQLNATGAGNAVGHGGDLFNPDVLLDGTNSSLAAGGKAVDTTQDFTVSAWVNPVTSGGTVLSQDGTHTAGFRISANPTDNSWLFALSRSDVNSPAWDVAEAHSASVRPGVWTHLTATYNHTSGVTHLYVDGVDAASTTHTTTWSATNGFQMGDYLNAGTRTDYLDGQLAMVQTWNQVVSPTQATTPASYYQPVPQTRLLDTRTTGPVAANAITRLQITGKAGVPTSNVTAVAFTLTVTAPTTAGHLDVYPNDTPPVGTSNVNFVAGQTLSNYVIVPVGPDGDIDLANISPGTVQLLADITGYFTSDASASGDTSYVPMTPTRLMDTRDGTGGTHGPLPAGSTTPLTVGGAAGIPTGVTDVAVNITATDETVSSYLITYADGTTKPAISGLQFTAGQDISGLAIVPVGTNGKIDLFSGGTTGSSTDLIVDAVGYFTPGTTGQKYHALPATRMIDTRQTGGPVTNRATLPVAQGNIVVAADPTLVLNMTATSPTANGFLVAYPDGTTMPGTSNVNYVTNQTIPNLDLAPVGDTGTLDITNQSSGTVQIIVDCLGYFADN